MRLRRPQEFQQVWNGGRSWAHPLFILRAAPHPGMPLRIGITASRKVGNAVARNRARRLLREAARHLYPALIQGWDVVLIARSPLLRAKMPEVLTALEQRFRSAGLWAAEIEAS